MLMKRISHHSGASARLRLGALSLAMFVGAAPAAQFSFPGQTLTVPDGFVVEQVAGPPLVDRPIMADFDERGRLYVAESAGVNDPVQKQLQTRPHRVLRLEDTDGDGRFDRRTVFADHMMFLEGVLWCDGAVYCAAPPSIWKLEDTDGDGVADRRSEWYRGLTLTGCANDLHGPYLGVDGWFYWCKGAFAQQTHTLSGNRTIADSAAHIFRARPDGSEFDSVISGGMDNPVEIAFTPEGETIFTTTFYTNPAGGKRDALVHAVYGGVYPKVHGVLDGLTRTGDLLPPITHLGPAAACALMRYSSTVFGPEYQGNLFSTLFNLRKVVRHVLRQEGATFATTDLDFLVSDNPDFHPTDVLEDADGSLLVIDTGGWYKLCCPTSQLAKPEALGAIYRIRRVGARPPEDPRGLQLAWTTATAAELTGWLADARPAVVKRALAALGKRGNQAVPALADAVRHGATVQSRQNAVWALTRIDGPEARAAVRPALADPEVGVRQAATHSIGLWRDHAALAALLEELRSSSLHLERNAATALGRLGDPAALPALLTAAARPHDRMLEHALIYALIEIGSPAGVTAGLTAESPFTRRAALIALDQMPGGHLAPSNVIGYLASTNATLKEAALWIVAHHAGWGGELAGLYSRWLRDPGLTGAQAAELWPQLAQFGADPAIQQVLAATLADPAMTSVARGAVLESMAHSPLPALPAVWLTPLEAGLRAGEAQVLGQTLAVLRALPLARADGHPDSATATPLTGALLGVARNPSQPPGLRLAAIAALPLRLEHPDPALYGFLIGALDATNAPLDRSEAATALSRARLSQEQLLRLADALPAVGPMELPKLLLAFTQTTNETVGRRLVGALQGAGARSALRAEAVSACLAKYPTTVQAEAKPLLAGLNRNAAQERAHLDQLLAGLQAGNRDRGRRLFESAKTACSTCHQIGYVGGHVGPDLTKIGAIRTERDLLESVVYPSASFVRSFEPVIVATKEGDEYSGVLRQESADSILVISGPGAEHRLAMADVAEMRPGTVSVMPEGLTQALSTQDLSDLITFLKSLQ